MEQPVFILPTIPAATRKIGKTPEQFAEILSRHFLDQRTVVAEPEIALEVFSDITGHRPWGTNGNFSLITGKAKSRKTFLVAILTAAYLSGDYILGKIRSGIIQLNKRTVLYIDTEQSAWHSQKLQNRILRLIGKEYCENLKFYTLRSLDPAQRLELVDFAIKNTENLGLVIIDGIIDLTSGSMNDDKDDANLPGKLLSWTEKFNIHIITVLHQNKNDSNARGHLGSFLTQKAETVASVSKEGEHSIVSFDYCRNIEPEGFAFGIDENGLPFLNDMPLKVKSENKNHANKMEAESFNDLQHNLYLNEVFIQATKPTYATLIDLIRKTYKNKNGENIKKSEAESIKIYLETHGFIKGFGTPGTRYFYYQQSTNPTNLG